MDYINRRAAQGKTIKSKNIARAESNGIPSSYVPMASTFKSYKYEKSWKENKKMTTRAQEIIEGKGGNPLERDIKANLKAENYYNSQVQHTYENYSKLANMMEESKKSAFGNRLIVTMDSEWIGSTDSGTFLDAHVIEVGINLSELKNGKVVPLGIEKSLFLSMEEEESMKVDKLLSRLEKYTFEGKGSRPALTADERRSLSDLIKYSAKQQGDVSTIINSRINIPQLSYTDIYDKDTLANIRAGFENLKHGNKTKGTITRAQLGTEVNNIIMQGGYSLEDDKIYNWHNGVYADLPVIEANQKKAGIKDPLMELHFGHSNKGDVVIDTFSFNKITGQSPLDLHRHGKVGLKENSVRGASKLSSVYQSIVGEEAAKTSYHIASADAGVGSVILGEELSNPISLAAIEKMKKDYNSAPSLKPGMQLVTTGSVYRGSPFDGVLYGTNEGIKMQPGDVVLPKNSHFRVEKIVEEMFEGKKYNTMHLYNMDQDTHHVFSRDNFNDFTDTIHSKTKVYDKNDKVQVGLRHFKMKMDAGSTYDRMFSGSSSSYYFDQNIKALKYLEKEYGHDNLNKLLDKRNYKLNEKVTKELIKNGILPEGQANKFSYAFPRMWSERDILMDFKDNVLDEIEKGRGQGEKDWQVNVRKRAALAIHKKNIDANISRGVDTVKVPDHMTFAMIPSVSGKMTQVNTSSIDDLSTNIRYMLTEASKGTTKFNFGDVKAQARELVYGLASQGMIADSEAQDLLEAINAFRGDPGKTTGVADISREIASRIHPQLQMIDRVETVGGFSKSEITDSARAHLTSKSLHESTLEYIEKRQKHGNKKGLIHYGEGVVDRLAEVDEYINKYAKQFSDIVDDKDFAPRPVLDMVAQLTGQFEEQGVAVGIELTEKGDRRGPGMIMHLLDKENSSALLAGNTGNAATMFIPILDKNTGLLMANGSPVLNTLDLVQGNEGYRFGTIQEKVFRGIKSWDISNISESVREGNYKDATKAAKRVVDRASIGSGGGATYWQEQLKHLTASTPEARRMKSARIVLDSVYQDAKADAKRLKGEAWKTKDEIKFNKEFAEIITLTNDKTGDSLGGDLGSNPTIIKFKQFERQAGIALTGANVKPGTFYDMHIAGILSGRYEGDQFIMNKDRNTWAEPRSQYPFGFYDTASGESIMASLNYLPLNKEMGNQRLKALDVKNNTDNANRLTEHFFRESWMKESIHSENFTDELPEGTSQYLNLRIANVTDKTNYLKTKEWAEGRGMGVGDINPYARFTTRNDMMIVNENVATAIAAQRQRVITLDDNQTLLESIKASVDSGEGIIIQPGDAIATNIGYNKSVTQDEILAYKDKLFPNQSNDSKYSSKVVGYHEQDGKVTLNVIDYIFGQRGTKGITRGAGSKATMEIFVAGKAEQGLFEDTYGDKIDALMYLGSNKRPSVELDSAVDEMINQVMTVDGMSTEEAQSKVIDILNKSGIQDDRVQWDKEKLVMPSDVRTKNKKGIQIGQFIKDVNYHLKEVGAPGIIRGQGETMHTIGSVKLGIADVDEYATVVGAGGKLVKFGHREVESVAMRNKHIYDGQISTVVKTLEDMVFTNDPLLAAEKRNMLDSLRVFGGENLADEAETGFIAWNPLKDNTKYSEVLNFGDLDPIMKQKSSGYFGEELRGTVVDDLFDGKAFYMELPEPVTITERVRADNGAFVDKSIVLDKIRMQPMQWQGEDGELHLTEVAKSQHGVYNTMLDWNDARNSGNAAEEVRATERLNQSVFNLFREQGNAMFSPKGYIAEKDMHKRVAHSGHFALRGVSGQEYLDSGLHSLLEENVGVISRADMRAMAEGYTFTDGRKMNVNDFLDHAENHGVIGLFERYPHIEDGSTTFLKYKVQSKEQEKLFIDKFGEEALRGQIMLTVGTEARLKADFDGDKGSGILFTLAGQKVRNMEELFSNKLYKESQLIQRTEAKWATKVADATFQDTINKEAERIQGMLADLSEGEKSEVFRGLQFGQAVTDSYLSYGASFIKEHEEDRIKTEVSSIAVRVLKQVGIYSNLSTRMGRSAESTYDIMTLGDSVTEEIKEKASRMRDLTRFIGSSLEQSPISAKQGDTQLQGRALEEYKKFLGSGEDVQAGIYAGNREQTIKAMEGLGFFDGNKFIGTGKHEDALIAAMEQHDWGEGGVQKQHIEEALDTFFANRPKYSLSSPSNSILLKDVSRLEDAEATDAIFSIARSLRKTNVDSLSSNYTFGKYTRDLLDEESKAHIADIAKQQINKSSSLSADKIRMGHQFYSNIQDTKGYTVGDEMRKIAATTSSDLLGNMATPLKVGGAVLGAGWLLSSFTASPTNKHKPVDARADQAPSSDGNYVDPTIYAGAPPGSEPPTARVSPMGGNNINIGIEGSSLYGLKNDEVAALISGEIQRQTQMNMNININSQDSRKNIDRNWLQTQFGNAIRGGYSY